MTSKPPENPKSNQSVPQRRFIQVCQYRSCQRFHSDAVLAAFKQHASPDLMVSASSCLGQCGSGPTVRVVPDNVWYCRVRPDDIDEILDQHIHQGKPVKRLLHPRFHPDYSQLLESLKPQTPKSENTDEASPNVQNAPLAAPSAHASSESLESLE